MKEKILEALKKKFANFGFDAKVLEGVASFLEPTITSEDAIDNSVAGVEGLLKSFQSNFDKIRTEKAEAEKRLKELEGKQPTAKEETKEEKEQPKEDDKTAILLKEIEEMKAKFDALEKAKTVGTRKSKLEGLIKDLPKPMQLAYKHMSLDNLKDDEFNSIQEEIAKEVKSYNDEVKTKGATFGSPLAAAPNKPKVELSEKELDTLTAGLNI